MLILKSLKCYSSNLLAIMKDVLWDFHYSRFKTRYMLLKKIPSCETELGT